MPQSHTWQTLSMCLLTCPVYNSWPIGLIHSVCVCIIVFAITISHTLPTYSNIQPKSQKQGRRRKIKKQLLILWQWRRPAQWHQEAVKSTPPSLLHKVVLLSWKKSPREQGSPPLESPSLGWKNMVCNCEKIKPTLELFAQLCCQTFLLSSFDHNSGSSQQVDNEKAWEQGYYIPAINIRTHSISHFFNMNHSLFHKLTRLYNTCMRLLHSSYANTSLIICVVATKRWGLQESSQIASQFHVSGWINFMIIACHCTDHEIEFLEEKLKKTGLESLEVCKFFPYLFLISPSSLCISFIVYIHIQCYKQGCIYPARYSDMHCAQIVHKLYCNVSMML